MAKKPKVTKRDIALFRKAMFSADDLAWAAGRKAARVKSKRLKRR